MTQYYQKIGKISNVANKNRMLRLLQGDVYCGDRLVRFGMTESDRCRRCFEKETIIHLTLECPYTKLVLQKLGMRNYELGEVLGITLNRYELEIRSDVLSYLVFKQAMIQPNVLVRTTLEKYAKGLVKVGKIQHIAERQLAYLRENNLI